MRTFTRYTFLLIVSMLFTTAWSYAQPTDITLSNSALNENNSPPSSIGIFGSPGAFLPEYSLVSGPGDADNGSFTLTGSSSEELRATVSFDFEAKTLYLIRVRVTDFFDDTYDEEFTITVNNVNEAPTDISLSNTSVSENLPAGTLVGTLSTTDPDAGGSFTYTKVAGAGDGDNASFSMGPGGALNTAASFNYEAKSSYSVRIQSQDNGGLTTAKSFTISVANANDAPTDIALSVNSINENAPAGTSIGTFTSTDEDAGDSFTYSLVAGAGSTDNGSFYVDGTVLKNNFVFDFETKPSYSIRVRTTDLGAGTFEEIFTINVNDIDEAPTDIGLTLDEVAENLPVNTVVGLLSTTDPDDIAFVYTLVSGTGSDNNASFNISGEELRTSAIFDFETKPSYSIRIRSTAGTLFFEEIFVIQVTDINEPPVITGNIVENLINPGVFAVGETVTANTGLYADPEGDLPGTHTFRWFRSNDGLPPGNVIPGATAATYVIVPADKDKFIAAGVTPVASAGTSPGAESVSPWYSVSELPSAVISGNDVLCAGSDGEVTITLTGSNPPWDIVYTIDGAPKPPITALNSPYVLNTDIAGTYELVSVSDDEFEFGIVSGTATIAYFPAVSATLTLAQYSICGGDAGSHDIPVLLTGTSPWNITYTRNGASPQTINGITETDTEITLTGTSQFGTYAITEVTDANCTAAGTGSTLVKLLESPTVSIAGDSLKCPYESSTLPVSLTGNGPWTFRYTRNGGAEVSVNVNQNPSPYTYNLSVPNPGTYAVTFVSDQDGEGCVNPGTATVTDYPLPVGSFASGPEVCEAAQNKLPVALTGTGPWTVTYRYETEPPVVYTGTSTQQPYNIPVSAGPGTYTLLDAVDKFCNGNASGTIEIIEAPEVSLGIDNTTQLASDPDAPLTVNPKGGHFDDSDDDRPFIYNSSDSTWTFVPVFAYAIHPVGQPFDIVYSYEDSGTQCVGKDSLKVLILNSAAGIFVDDDTVGKRYCFNQDTIILLGTNIDQAVGTFSISSNSSGLVNLEDNVAGLLPWVLQSGSYTVTYSVMVNGVLVNTPKVFTFERIDGNFTWDNECFTGQSLVNFSDQSTASDGVELLNYQWNILVDDELVTSDTTGFSYTFQNLEVYPVEFIVGSESCNDTVKRDLILRPTIPVYETPYSEDFSDGSAYWTTGTSLPGGPISWTFGSPQGNVFDESPYQLAWYTSIQDKKAEENSYVISPCFDFSESERPMIQLRIWQEFTDGALDGANLQYKINDQPGWMPVGTESDGDENWYNSSAIIGNPGNSSFGWTANSPATTKFVTSRHTLDNLKDQESPVRFRINYGSPEFNFDNERDGIAFDDIWIGERSKKILIEHFTNMSDTVSMRANAGLNEVTALLGSDIIDIQYHLGHPGADVFHSSDPLSPQSREFYYQLGSVPFALIDGGKGGQAGQIDYKNYEDPIDQENLILASLKPNAFDIDLSASESGGILTVDATVTSNQNLGVLKLAVRVVVIEKLITSVTSVHGENQFSSVSRAMLPDALGVYIYDINWTTGTSENISLNYYYDGIYDTKQVRVVVFVQNEDTHEVYQAEIADPNAPDALLPTFGDTPPALVLYPNPAYDKVILEFHERTAGQSRIELVDNAGRLVYSDELFYGQDTEVLELGGLEPGIYIVRLIENGKLSGVGKLLVLGKK